MNKKFSPYTLYNIIVATLLLTLGACKTTERARRGSYQPDAAHTPAMTSELLTAGEVVQQAQPAVVSAPALSPLQQKLEDIMRDSVLVTTQAGIDIIDLTTGERLYSRGERQRMRPASSEKMVTAIAALDVLGPQHAFTTQLLTTGSVEGGVLRGDLYVRGTMDPLLTAADVRGLVSQLRSAGVRSVSGRLIADASFKDSDEFGWGWCWDDDNPTLSPLLCGGKPRLADELQAALRAAGIRTAALSVGSTPASARVLAEKRRPLTEVLQRMMKESDNLCAEAVFYQLAPLGAAAAAKGGKSYSRKQAVAVVNAVIAHAYETAPIGAALPAVASTIADGSGLSLYNYQTPETFTRLLTYAALRQEQIFTPLLASLPIAATDGTLKKRMAGTAAAGNVRAKTGSVSAVSTLVGYTTQRSTGHLIAFAIMNQGLRTMAEGRNLQDRICCALSE